MQFKTYPLTSTTYVRTDLSEEAGNTMWVIYTINISNKNTIFHLLKRQEEKEAITYLCGKMLRSSFIGKTFFFAKLGSVLFMFLLH